MNGYSLSPSARLPAGSAILGIAALALLLACLLPHTTYIYPDGEVVEGGSFSWFRIALMLFGTSLLVLAIAIAVKRRPLAAIMACALSIVALVVVSIVAAKTTGPVERNAAAGLVLATVSAIAAVIASLWCVVQSVLDSANLKSTG